MSSFSVVDDALQSSPILPSTPLPQSEPPTLTEDYLQTQTPANNVDQTPAGSVQIAPVSASALHMFSQQLASPTPTHTRVSNKNGKRPGDLQQYAQSLGRNVRLKTKNQALLQDGANLDGASQYGLWLASHVLTIRERLDMVHPPNTPNSISPDLAGKISALAVKIFLDPTLSAYIGPRTASKDGPASPTELVINWLREHPRWLTPDMADSTTVMQSLRTKIGDKLTRKRNETKDLIGESLGQFSSESKTFKGPFVGVVELSRAIINKTGGKEYGIQLSIPLVARIAFLRSKYVDESRKTMNGKPGADYWKDVDTVLQNIRTTKGNDKVKISKVFSKILEHDRNTFDEDCNEDSEIHGMAEICGFSVDDEA